MESDINENLSDNLSLKCWFCKNNHRLTECPSFKNRSVSERRQFVKENKLYSNFKAQPKNSNQVKQYATVER